MTTEVTATATMTVIATTAIATTATTTATRRWHRWHRWKAGGGYEEEVPQEATRQPVGANEIRTGGGVTGVT
jgi:heptaprenylglyceryl phosphate synthase